MKVGGCSSISSHNLFPFFTSLHIDQNLLPMLKAFLRPIEALWQLLNLNHGQFHYVPNYINSWRRVKNSEPTRIVAIDYKGEKPSAVSPDAFLMIP